MKESLEHQLTESKEKTELINSLQENTVYLIDEKEALTKKYKTQNETLEKQLKVLEQKHETAVKNK